jgi:hypothetical protein
VPVQQAICMPVKNSSLQTQRQGKGATKIMSKLAHDETSCKHDTAQKWRGLSRLAA